MWLISGIKHHKDNRLQLCNYPVEYSSWESKFDIDESDGNTFNAMFQEKVQGQNYPVRLAAAEP